MKLLDQIKKHRDLAIEKAVYGMFTIAAPELSIEEIRQRSSTKVYTGYFIVSLDNDELVRVDLISPNKFSITILA